MAELNRSIESRVAPMISKVDPSWGEKQRSLSDESDYKKFIEEAVSELQTRVDSKRSNQ